MPQESLETKYRWLQNEFDGAVALIVLTVVFVSLRCVGLGYLDWRSRRTVSFGWEEALLVGSLLVFVPMCICAIEHARKYSAFYSTSSTTEQITHRVEIFQASYGTSVTYPLACTLPKISICLMYFELFKIDTFMRRATQTMMAFLAANCIAWLIPSIIVCQPISAYWTGNRDNAKCIDISTFGTWISLPHVVSDLVLMGMPMRVLWKMHVNRAKKLGLMFTFLTTSVGIVGGCLRLALYSHRTYIARPGQAQTTRSIAAHVITSYVEPGMYLIAACLPRLRPLFKELWLALNAAFKLLLKHACPARHAIASENVAPAHSIRRVRHVGKHGKAPQIEMDLTGQGNMTGVVEE